MDYGVAIFATDRSIDPGEAARLAEERGFESFFVPEHTHIPASRETPYPGGAELPPEYERTLDPAVALTCAAAATSTIRVGFGVLLVNQHHAISLAKQIASLDHVSGGRVLCGVGAGWNVEEMQNHGVQARGRFGLMREQVEAMKAIWTQDEASYDGARVSFERVRSWPKPVQRPHPPVLVGGNGAKVLERVVAFGDEWYPNRVGDDESFLGRVEELQRLAGEAGRDPIPVTLNGATRNPDLLSRYERGGVHRCVYWLPSAPREEVEPMLDKIAATIVQAG